MRLKTQFISFKLADWLDFIKVNYFGYHRWDIMVHPITNGNYRYGLTCEFSYGLYNYLTGKRTDKKLDKLLKDVDHYPFTLYHEIKRHEDYLSVRFCSDDLTDIVKILLWFKDMKSLLKENAPEPYFLHMPFKNTKDKNFEYLFNNNDLGEYKYLMVASDENGYYEYFTNKPKNLLVEANKLKNYDIRFYKCVSLGQIEILYMQKRFMEFMDLIQPYKKSFKKERIVVVFYLVEHFIRKMKFSS